MGLSLEIVNRGTLNDFIGHIQEIKHFNYFKGLELIKEHGLTFIKGFRKIWPRAIDLEMCCDTVC